ncbi:MAG: TfoX/Sxy family protein [Gemmatimonadaceae bacterium]|nr:TfoX/Sxy family protein [Gemmatimonadaceae bacterium]
MTWDAGLAERMRDVLPRLAGGAALIREKNVFGGRGFLLGKSAFLIVWGPGVLVKCPSAEYNAALATRGVTPFAPMGGRAMGTWVVVTADEVADDPELLEWTERGLRGVRDVPDKPRKAPRPRGRSR